MNSARRIAALLLCALGVLFPAAAQAQDAAGEPAPAASAPAEPGAQEPAQQAAASPPQAVAKPAQSSAPNEYFEGGVPTGTGDDEPAEPTQPTEPEDDEPQSNASPSPSTSTPSATTAATETVAEGDTLPRTGLSAWLIALTGSALLAAGLVARRAVPESPR